MVAALGRALFLGGGMIGNVLGGALSGAGAAVGGLAQGAGSAVGGIGQGIGAAVGGALTPAPKTIVNNFGIAGSAAKGKVTGGGTLPALKKTSAPAVNVNMPTEKLLVVAVNYLSSIDKTLQAQIKFERDAFVQQAQAERESSIESGGQKESIFTKLSEKFSGKSDDSTVKSRAITLTKTILAAAGIAGLGLLALGNLDTKELDRLKDSYKAFNEKFDFLGPLAEGVSSTGSIVGYLLKGLRGGIAGLVAEYLVKRFTGKSIFENITGTGEEANGTQASAPQKPGSYDYAMAGGLAGYGAYRGVKTFGKIKDARANIAKIRAAPQVAPSLKGSGFRDPVTGRAAKRAAVTSGGGWLSGPKGQRWVAFLQKRFGKTFFAKKIMPLLARALVGIGIAATGIGVIPGALLTLITVASSAFLIYDIISAYWDWTEEEDALKDAQPAAGLKPKSDAMATPSSPASTDSLAAAPVTSTTSATAGQNKPITGVVEGGAGYTTVTYADGTTERRGGTLPARTNNPGNIMDGSLARSYGSVGSSPSTNGPPVAVFPTRVAGFAAMDALLKSEYSNGPIGQTLENWATDPDHPAKVIGTARVDPNKKYTDFTHDEKVRFMQALAKVEGFYAAGSGPKISSAELGNSGLLSSAIGLGKGAMEAIGTVLRAGLGEMKPTTGSQLSGFNDTMRGNTSSATPVQGESTTTAQLARTSAQIQNAVDLGNADAAQAATQKESAGASSIRQANASNDGKLECLDPNFPGNGSVEAYLQYHRLAA
jgi:hypothetical protein